MLGIELCVSIDQTIGLCQAVAHGVTKHSRISIIIIIIIIIIVVVSFMQGIYTYIPETNCVPTEYTVTAILLLLFIVSCSVQSIVLLH